DKIGSQIYLKSFLQKAKKENDTLKMAKAYRYYLYYTKGENTIAYSDSIINLTKSKQYELYPLLGYFYKGISLYTQRNFNRALDNFIEARKYTTIESPDIESYNDHIKTRLRHYKEALKSFTLTLNLYDGEKHINGILQSYYSIGDTYLFLKNKDS